MELETQLEALFKRTTHGIKFGLEIEQALLDKLGDPHLKIPCVHVAGTNGKGSVCAMIESVLRATGCKTGLYTSPHLVRVNERIRVNGTAIADSELQEVLNRVVGSDDALVGQGNRPSTFFELLTAMAFDYFKQCGVDIGVLETGMGGRLDATNVVVPVVSVITRLDIEHTAYLGNTLEEIAAEKCGIIKPGRPVVSIEQDEEALVVIQRIAAERGSRLIMANESVTVRRISQAWSGQKIKIQTANADYPQALLPLLGKHQLENGMLAVAALECMAEECGVPMDGQAVATGLENVRWPGRCQVLSEDPVVLLDVAHNPNGARALAGSLKELKKKKDMALIAGLLGDKDCRGFVKALAPLTKKCWAVPIHNERGMNLQDLVECFRTARVEVKGCSLAEALREAKTWALENDAMVCIAGSLYLAGEVLQIEGVNP